jgi:prolyl-tRNA synthetase
MSDGKALQMGTSHNLGQHFSKAFDIKFEDRNQTLQYVWQTSWGTTTRMIGAVIMAHGDDSGLRLPPRVAPVQAVLVPIAMGNWKETVLPTVRAAEESLKKAGVRVQVDAREEFTPGWKFAEHEMRGVPLRIEIGPRDVKAAQAVLVRRDAKTKESVPLTALVERAIALLDDIQASLFKAALQYREENTREAGTYADLKDLIETKRGFVKSPWCGEGECEDRIKTDTMATIRVIPPDCEGPAAEGKICVCCGREAKAVAYFARAY